jgi:hypothetical protein
VKEKLVEVPMFSSQTLPRDDEYHERDVVERDLGAGGDSFDQRIGGLKNLNTTVGSAG